MEKKNKLRARYSGPLRKHWQWSTWLALTLLILDAVLLWEDPRAGMTGLVFTVLYFLAILLINLHSRPRILRELVNFATGYGQIQRQILQEFDIPCCLLEPDGRILWMNDQMSLLTGLDNGSGKNISSLFPQINRGSLPASGIREDIQTSYQDHDYRARTERIVLGDLIDASELVEKEESAGYLYIVYLFDETRLTRALLENREQKPVVGLAYLDNYEEVMDRTDEVHQSLLNVLVERKVTKYFSMMNALVKKLEKDKYLVVCSRKSLDAMMEERFTLLDGVRSISIGNEISMTVSCGIGACGSYNENYDLARGAIEMALGRGGDQVVIKDGEEIRFFGGKTQRNEKGTRVKARVKAQALREMMLSQDKIVTMGHSLTDMDSFGAAIGVARAAMTIDKPVHIVLGELNTNIREWVTLFRESSEYPDDLFITHEQAIEMVDRNTTLIVVDTNRANMVECREILGQTKSLVVMDHHRQTADTITDASLSYIEPSASSACEMIAEILQYFEESVKLKSLEADCIYAGIVIDTQSFVDKTGVRTFEAAAYLRQCGADITRVRKTLRDSADSYKAKAEAVGSAETYMKYYALSICNGEGLEDPNVVGAQAANDLLNIAGVKASFVITPVGDRIFISARSIDELNVQLVMERLGGGGHLSIAGAQLTGVTAQEAVEQVKTVLREMTEEGAI